MPPGFSWPDGIPRGRLLHVRRRRGEPDPVRASRGRRLARRHDPPGLRAAHRRAAAPAPPRPAGRPGHVLRPGLHRRALAGRGPRDPGRRPRDRPPRLPARGRASAPTRTTRSAGCCAASRRSTRSLGVRPVGYRAPMWELTVPTARAPRQARLPLRRGPDGRRPSVPAGDRSGAPARRRSSSCPATGASTTGSRTTTCPGSPAPGVIASPAEVLARWTLELEALVAEGGLFMLTNHPFVSRPGLAGGRARDAHRAGEGDRRAVDRNAPRDRRARGDAAAEPVVHLPHQASLPRDGDEPRRLLTAGAHCCGERLGSGVAARPLRAPNQ